MISMVCSDQSPSYLDHYNTQRSAIWVTAIHIVGQFPMTHDIVKSSIFVFVSGDNLDSVRL